MDDRVRWSVLERVFHKALELDAGERAEYVRTACGSDEDLRIRVESLLRHDDLTAPVPASPFAPRIGPYEVLTKVGAGGMGEVFLARDTRLGRQVALKILPRQFANDPERKRRFLHEAKAASALNHPNIVIVHDVGTDGELDYLVMEYVAGKPLDRLIPHDGLKLKEALKYGMQVAEALAAAHAAGIIHRDLKPANVLITESGVAKVVDFGLAKQVRAGPDAAALTQAGVIIGTAAYMSPEQAEGRPVDSRSDIFSFGSLVYEMVTGQRAFQRDTTAATLAAVLREEPKLANALAGDVPLPLAQLIQRCLRKEPAGRYKNMDELRSALEEVKRNVETTVFTDETKPAPGRRRLPWVLGTATAAVAVAGVLFWRMLMPPAEDVLRSVPLTTYPGFEGTASFSPDGQQVAFSWCQHEGTPPWLNEYITVCNIYVKQIGVEPPSRLTMTSAKEFSPAWSPDGKWIAFLRMDSSAKLALVVIPQRGGRERVLHVHDLTGSADMPPGPYLDWTPDSRRLICATPGRKAWHLSLVALNSAENRALTDPSPAAAGVIAGDTAPAISPDGRVLVFSRFQDGYDLYKLRLSEQYATMDEPVKLRSSQVSNIGTAWLPDGGGIVFASGERGQNGLWRTSVSSSAGPTRLPFAPAAAAEPAISRTGKRLAYTTYWEDTNIWRMDLLQPGHRPAAPVPIVSSTKADDSPAVSPDGKTIAFVSERSGTREVWLCDRDGLNPRQLTSFEGTFIDGPQWSPDGQNLAVALLDAQPQQKVGIISAGTGALRVLSIPGGAKWPSWSPDGRWLYFAATANDGSSIWKIRPGGGIPQLVVAGTSSDMPQPSSDGKFVYYNKGWPGPLSIWRVPSGGGQETKVADGISSVGQWTTGPDGIYFFAAPDSNGRTEIRVYEFATGRTNKILTLDRSIGFRIAVSPDGRTIYYVQTDNQGSDLMLVENFH